MIKAPSALDALLKKEAEQKIPEKNLPKKEAVLKKEAGPVLKKEAAQEQSAEKLSSYEDDVIDNTVALFHEFQRR